MMLYGTAAIVIRNANIDKGSISYSWDGELCTINVSIYYIISVSPPGVNNYVSITARLS